MGRGPRAPGEASSAGRRGSLSAPGGHPRGAPAGSRSRDARTPRPGISSRCPRPDPRAARGPGEIYRVVRAGVPACAALEAVVEALYPRLLPRNLVAPAQANPYAVTARGALGLLDRDELPGTLNPLYAWQLLRRSSHVCPFRIGSYVSCLMSVHNRHLLGLRNGFYLSEQRLTTGARPAAVPRRRYPPLVSLRAYLPPSPGLRT